MKRDREPAYGAGPGEQTDPILVEMGMDVRMYLQLDLRKFLDLYGVDPNAGQPTPEELQVHVLGGLMQYLKSLPYMVTADVNFIDDAIA